MRSPYILRRDYTIDLSPGYAVDIDLGLGVDMSNPLDPRPRRVVFKPRAKSDATLPPSNDLIQFQGRVVEATSEYQEAYSISVYFRGQANWGTGSVDASATYNFARQQMDSRHILYVTFESVGEGSRLMWPLEWLESPLTEQIVDDDDRLEQFLLRYGSHFVTTVTSGQKLVIRFSMRKTSDAEQRDFTAAVNAVAASASVSAGMSEKHLKILTSTDVEVWAAIVGEIKPKQFQYMTGLTDVLDTLQKLRKGEATVQSGPVRCDLVTFRSELQDYPKTRAVFDEKSTRPAPAPYGVPRGTVVPWVPTIENTTEDPVTKMLRIIPPEGWALCDGNGTPDLRDRFICGTADFTHLNDHGSPTHQHRLAEGSTGESRHTQSFPGGSGYGRFVENVQGRTGGGDWLYYQHNHSLGDSATTAVTAMPPFWRLVFIVKL